MPDLASLIELAGTGNEFFYNGLLGGEDGRGGLCVRLGRQGGADAPLSDPFDVSLYVDDTDCYFSNGYQVYAIDVEGVDYRSLVISRLRSMYPEAVFDYRVDLASEPSIAPTMLWNGGMMSREQFMSAIPGDGSSILVALMVPVFLDGYSYTGLLAEFYFDNDVCYKGIRVDEYGAMTLWDGSALQHTFSSLTSSQAMDLADNVREVINGLLGSDFTVPENPLLGQASKNPGLVLSWT